MALRSSAALANTLSAGRSAMARAKAAAEMGVVDADIFFLFFSLFFFSSFSFF
jgi:hypothetical protein